MLGAEGAYSFPYIRAGNVKLQHFLSRTLFDTHHVKGKERTVFVHQVRKVTAFPPALVLYSARCVSSYSILHLAIRYSARSRKVTLERDIFYFISLTGLTHSPSCTTFGMHLNRVMKDCVIV